MGFHFKCAYRNIISYNNTSKLSFEMDRQCGSDKPGPLPWRCFYWTRDCLCVGVFWFGGYVSVAALSLWLSKLCACRGWLAGRLRNGWACRSWAGGGNSAFFTTYEDIVFVILGMFQQRQVGCNAVTHWEIEFFAFEQIGGFLKTKSATTD